LAYWSKGWQIARRRPPERDVVRHVRHPDGAEEDGVVIADEIAAVLRHHQAVALVVIRAPIEMVEGEAEAAVAGGERLQDFDARGDHLLTDPVAGNCCDPIALHRAFDSTQPKDPGRQAPQAEQSGATARSRRPS
jgi:hypothetical protein